MGKSGRVRDTSGLRIRVSLVEGLGSGLARSQQLEASSFTTLALLAIQRNARVDF